MKFPRMSAQEKHISKKNRANSEMRLRHAERALVASQVWNIPWGTSVIPDIAAIVYKNGITGSMKYKPLKPEEDKKVEGVSAVDYREWLNGTNPYNLELIFNTAVLLGVSRLSEQGNVYLTNIMEKRFWGMSAVRNIKEGIAHLVPNMTIDDYEALFNLCTCTEVTSIIVELYLADAAKFGRMLKKKSLTCSGVKEISDFYHLIIEGEVIEAEVFARKNTLDEEGMELDYCPRCGFAINSNGMCCNYACNYIEGMERSYEWEDILGA